MAFYDWWETQTDGQQRLREVSQSVNPQQGREARKERESAQSEQLKRFRFRHKPQGYLASLALDSRY